MNKTFWKYKTEHSSTVAYNLKRSIPELKHVSTETIEYAVRKYTFLSQEKTKAAWWIRLTLPLAIVAWILLFIYLPVNYVIKGEWGYSNTWVENWFRQLS